MEYVLKCFFLVTMNVGNGARFVAVKKKAAYEERISDWSADGSSTDPSKSAEKSLMAKAGVPLVPGYHGDDQDPAHLQHEADGIGYPVLIKASAGGGGKGMRVVNASAEFAAALLSCQREARASFGDDRVLIEKYLKRPRHKIGRAHV